MRLRVLGRSFTKFWGARGCPGKCFVHDLFSIILVTVVDQWSWVQCCPAEIHCIAVFALRNGQFARVGEGVSKY